MPRVVLPFSVMVYCPFSGEEVYPFRVRSRRCIMVGRNSFPESFAICVARAGLSFRSMFSSILILTGDKLMLFHASSSECYAVPSNQSFPSF